MCNPSGIDFVRRHLVAAEIAGKSVLEVGARDVNGSVRPLIEAFGPARYVGADIEAGHRVDQLVDAVDLVKIFGAKAFDVVVTTEMLEHVPDWQTVISNLKQVLRPGGVLFLTTRSQGFPFHGYPHDYWRFEVEDFRAIFADLDIVALESDPAEPGVFLKARKPKRFAEADLRGYRVHSMAVEQAQAAIPEQKLNTVIDWSEDPDKPPHQWGIA